MNDTRKKKIDAAQRRQMDDGCVAAKNVPVSSGFSKWPGVMRGYGSITRLYEWEKRE